MACDERSEGSVGCEGGVARGAECATPDGGGIIVLFTICTCNLMWRCSSSWSTMPVLSPRTSRTLALACIHRTARPTRPLDDVGRRRPGRVVQPDPTESSPISSPTSPKSLYRNLLSITSNPSFSIRKAIDYYFDWPKALHSTKSFNLLISLALRNASFATVEHLLGAMRAESTPENMETRKLHVRWLVRIGRWNDAWKRVLQITGKQNVSAGLPISPIPLPLWLELFGTQQRGALRCWTVTDRKSNMGSRLHASVQDSENSIPLLRKRLLPRPCRRPYTVELSQYRALMQVSPLLTSSGHVQILPRTILIITQAMYRVGQTALALSTALSYLKSLPPQLRRCDRRRVVDLINLHLSMVTRHKKPGLKQHFAQRHILWKFLQARPDVTPSSTTLFLLLRPLRSCRRSGTLAMQCLNLFEKRWGPRVQSSPVRRRVASLALKEGRSDIVAAMIRLEWRRRIFNDTFPRTIYTSRRKPWRTLFSRRGAENRRWHLIEETFRRRMELRSELKAA